MKNNSNIFCCLVSLASLVILAAVMVMATHPALVAVLSIFSLAPASLFMLSVAQAFSDSYYIHFDPADCDRRRVCA